VKEKVSARVIDGMPVIQRSFQIDRVPEALVLVLGRQPVGGILRCAVGPLNRAEFFTGTEKLLLCRVAPSSEAVEFRVAFATDAAPASWVERIPSKPPSARWPDVVVTRATPKSVTASGCVVDDIPLPTNNPWRRNVRLADIAFRKDGRAALVTFDGDVWWLDGLAGAMTELRWRRHASGFHEPLGIA